MCAELDQIQRLGWRSSVFMADDNFIVNKKNVKLLLPRLVEWMQRLKMLFTCGGMLVIDGRPGQVDRAARKTKLHHHLLPDWHPGREIRLEP